ncbi:hypothetical protein [Trichoplusia ni single nucleopolyhedrovirus]|uniref:Uncharacterized protein n=1 Tax=Trichoplusia ni single nucleopolyhedrovirus TaxID=332054 RepID=Q461T2_9ABAC|nr:hypothetical protein TNSV_gp134 [Trichoplusia ni single nucleopolyhedrovirus]AAZ67504.1 hypothetical protein [Trichoplusia ni single nucleopolyhedrovirus]
MITVFFVFQSKKLREFVLYYKGINTLFCNQTACRHFICAGVVGCADLVYKRLVFIVMYTTTRTSAKSCRR